MTHHVSRFTHHPTESQTRETLIDPLLKDAGWDVENPVQVGIEVPVDQYDPAAWRQLAAQLRKKHSLPDVKLPVSVSGGICDYVLYLPNGDIVAAVEANLRRAERLRQSILKRAFEGRLVPRTQTMSLHRRYWIESERRSHERRRNQEHS